jgi:hypothetical protein
METPLVELAVADVLGFAEAIHCIRNKLVQRKAGFDGVFGRITVYNGGQKVRGN